MFVTIEVFEERGGGQKSEKRKKWLKWDQSLKWDLKWDVVVFKFHFQWLVVAYTEF